MVTGKVETARQQRLQRESTLVAPPTRLGDTPPAPLGYEDVVRARTYGLLAALVYATPSPELLQTLQSITIREQDRSSPMAASWEALKLSAEAASEDELDDEHHALFIGLGRGEIVPYASWYLTGFLMEQPLAALRNTLDALGFERNAQVREPEDHAAALCETMELLISCRDEYEFSLQYDFFRQHIRPWMGRFFSDLKQARSARFYRAVGQLGEHFIEIEQDYFSIDND